MEAYLSLLPKLWPYLPRIEAAIATIRRLEADPAVQDALKLGQELSHTLKDVKL